MKSGARAPAPYYVGARVDWLEWWARVEVSAECKAVLRERAIETQRDGQAKDVLVGGAAFKLSQARVEDRWVMQSDDVRLEVALHAPGGDPETGEPGYTVHVRGSSLSLLRLGLGGFVALCWRLARAVGRVVSARFGRHDLCVDVANYKLREDDAASFDRTASRLGSVEWRSDGVPIVEKSKEVRPDGETHRRHEVRRWALPGEGEERDGIGIYRVGTTLSGFTFGSGKTISVRVYDKQLHMQVCCPEKREDEWRYWRSNGWEGPDDAPHVTRIEAQIRGEALDELGMRHEQSEGPDASERQLAELRSSLDPLWRRMTADRATTPEGVEVRGWLRLVRRGSAPRRSDCALQPRWRAVAGAYFVEPAAHARPRFRERGAAKVPQLRGLVHSLLASTDRLPPAPWPARLDAATGEVLDDARVGESEHALVHEWLHPPMDPERALRVALRRHRASLAAACVPLDVEDLVARARAVGKGEEEDEVTVLRRALAMSWAGERAARARFSTVCDEPADPSEDAVA